MDEFGGLEFWAQAGSQTPRLFQVEWAAAIRVSEEGLLHLTSCRGGFSR